MMRFAALDDAGNVQSIIFAQDLDNLVRNLPSGCHAHACDDLRVGAGQWRWSADHGFLPIVVETPIAEVRAARWAEVRAQRDSQQRSGCMTPLGRVDTDGDSQLKIAGSVQMAMIAQAAGQPFSIEWTMQDNSTVTHDAAAMITMGIAVGRHIAACHEAALLKRAAIDVAGDVAAIAAVPVEGGWPDA